MWGLRAGGRVPRLSEAGHSQVSSVQERAGTTDGETRRKHRLAVCEGCPWKKATGRRLRCRVCGCFMWVKTALPFMRCPMGKW